MTARRKGHIKLGGFFHPTGNHVAAWLHPEAQIDAGQNFRHYVELAQIAEQAKFDLIFLPDSNATREGRIDVLSRSPQYMAHFEPTTLLAGIAAMTQHIGLIATATTSYNEPFNLARRFASIDIMSGGRAGWNVVTSQNKAEAYNFNREAHFEREEAYERGLEFVDVCKGLWDSYDDDAFVRDRDTATYFTPEKMHVLDHKGKHFTVRGPLNSARPIQGYPVLAQAGASEAEERIKVVRDRLRACPLPVLLLPDRSMTRILSYSGNRRSAGLSLCLQRSPLTIGELAEKRLIDIALSLTAILLLLPLLILVAAAIKLDSSGPIIFRQWRSGFNGRPFRILKFRTMHVMEDGPVIKQAEKIDPRVTRVGRILRRTSADELPQLFNVLLGHMSLVGPRPHAMAHDSIYSAQIADYAFRHHVKPGLTGWAQVNGNRGETPRLQDMERRIKCDLWYINHRSLILDLKIILRTCLLVARGDPAH